ncbi:MAG: 4Fe-4S binding protein, partial [Elusimicrobiota bacterium]|nr:4Fe-4S binding protein [Elusimicrobiota bacterium]
SGDAVAVSAAIEKMCGVKPEKVPITAEAAKRGLGKKDKFSIIKKYSGEEIEFKNFKTPLLSVLGRKIPIWMLDFVPNVYLHRPKVIKKDCVQCRECARVCPTGAIDFSPKGFPEFDMKKCVKCFCCAERCPENAIIEQTNFIAKLFS